MEPVLAREGLPASEGDIDGWSFKLQGRACRLIRPTAISAVRELKKLSRTTLTCRVESCIASARCAYSDAAAVTASVQAKRYQRRPIACRCHEELAITTKNPSPVCGRAKPFAGEISRREQRLA
jgi:hypothetical protein